MRLLPGAPDLKEIDRTLPNGDQVLFVSFGNRTIPPHEYIGERRRMAGRSINDMIMFYGNQLGIPVSQLHPHAMRHLYGTELAESDVDLLIRQDLMGHEDAQHPRSIRTSYSKEMTEVDKGGPLSKLKSPVVSSSPV